MPIFLGLDCGGTACRALALDEHLEPVFLAQGGSANLASTPEATLDRSLSRALEGLPHVDRVCACFAGLVSPEQRQRAEALVRRHIPDTPIRVEADYAAAWRASPEGTTVCVIAGTGSCLSSRRTDGSFVKSGGGGYLLGDECSGFRLGQAAIRSYVRNPAEASPYLCQLIHRTFGTSDPGEVTTAVYQSSLPAALIASLASAFFRDVESGVPYAVRSLTQEAAAMADIIVQHLNEFHPNLEEATVALAGSVWKKKSAREALGEAVRLRRPAIRVVRSEMPPARGAALLAMETL